MNIMWSSWSESTWYMRKSLGIRASGNVLGCAYFCTQLYYSARVMNNWFQILLGDISAMLRARTDPSMTLWPVTPTWDWFCHQIRSIINIECFIGGAFERLLVLLCKTEAWMTVFTWGTASTTTDNTDSDEILVFILIKKTFLDWNLFIFSVSLNYKSQSYY